jgi:signal transduction histidine kinase
MLMASLLRDREQLRAEVIQRKEAENRIEQAKRNLDLKVQERTAELKGVIQALESFNRNVSHDLRGPLGGIDMLAYTARKQLEIGDVKSAELSLQQINHQVRESQSTINTMLLLARTYGKEIHIHHIDLSDTVRHAAREAYISLSTETQSQSLPEILIGDLGFFDTDPSLIRIIFVNLISNSLKFNAGNSHVKIKINRDLQERNDLVLIIEDNGIGFDSENSSNIFDAFNRLPNSIQKPGFGLGLNIVKLAVDRLKGKISVKAEQNMGVSFKITLPHFADI